MDAVPNLQTSVTLLKRLRHKPNDEEAWGEFVRRYGKKILGWCLRWGLQEADAADVTQTVLLKLSKELQKFEYNPQQRFRGWLKTLAHHAWHDLITSRQHGAAEGGERKERFDSLEARDDLAKGIEAAWDQELLQLATDNVRLRVLAKTWEAFQLTALEGLSGQEAANRLGLSLGTVYKAKSNVMKLLQEEIKILEQTELT